MVVLASMIAGQSVSVGSGGVQIGVGGSGVIGSILLFQLVFLARRLLREGYAFKDIRAALLAEALVQEEEADILVQRRWIRRMHTMWHRLWAGKFGRWFFKVAGTGIRPPARPAHPSTDATEFVLGRAAIDVYRALPSADRTQAGDVPWVVRRLEHQAERLRQEGDAGDRLTETVAALEKVRLSLLRLQAGEGSVQDLTLQLERAKEIGRQIDRELEARSDVAAVLNGGG